MKYKDAEFMSLEDYIHSIYKNKIEDEYSDLIAKNEHIIVLPVRKIAFVYHPNDEEIYDNPYLLSKEYLKRDIRLVHIYQYEWVNNFTALTKFVFSIVVRQHKRTISSFHIKETSNEEYAQFMKDYHLFTDQDKGAFIKLGLYDNDNNLVAVAGFVHNKTYDFEWKRFVIRTDVVSEGFYIPDELFNYFKDNYMEVGQRCVDYAQLDRWPAVDKYTSLRFGFKKKGISKGHVWINDSGTRITRHDFYGEKKTTALALKNHPGVDWTPKQAAEFYGFKYRLANCGTGTFIYKKEATNDK